MSAPILPDIYRHATLATGNGGRTWHVLREHDRTECGQRPGRWATLDIREPPQEAPEYRRLAESRVCKSCRNHITER